MLKTVIVDDEILILELLKNMLQQEEQIEIVGEYTSPRKALAEIRALRPDLLFLDIEMPGMNGIELATQILNDTPDVGIVFVTAYDQYAVQAFKLNAIHYILKPPNPGDIRQAITRVISDKKTPTVKKSGKVFIRLFGGITVKDQAGNPLKWPTAKTEELFVFFLLSSDNGVDKWQIIDKLWPDSKQEKSEQLLYSTVYRLKKTLEEYGIKAIVYNKLGVYKMEIENIWCDVHEFENLYKNYNKTQDNDYEAYEKLFELYTGQLLGSRDYEWCELYKYELSRKFTDLLTTFEKYFDRIEDNNKVNELQIKRNLLG